MDEIYRQENQQNRQALDSMTRNKHWDSSDFGNILIALAKTGQTIPSPNRPETIHLQTWRPFVDKMWDHTKATRDETGRVVLADMEKDKIVMGKLSVGDDASVGVIATRQPGREAVQAAVAMIHCHPDGEMLGHGFSDQDYVSLMADPRMQATLVRYGDKKALLALKTSVTPHHSEKVVSERIKETLSDFMSQKQNPAVALAQFNKMVCLELGLTLYHMTPASGDMFNRIDVTT